MLHQKTALLRNNVQLHNILGKFVVWKSRISEPCSEGVCEGGGLTVYQLLPLNLTTTPPSLHTCSKLISSFFPILENRFRSATAVGRAALAIIYTRRLCSVSRELTHMLKSHPCTQSYIFNIHCCRALCVKGEQKRPNFILVPDLDR